MSVPKNGDDIAVIGMGCRFPGEAKSPQEFYEMLIKKRTGWREVPEDRFNVDSFWHPSYERHGTIVCKGGHFLEEDIGLFDAPFFSMTQGEANAMDPQQRILLETTYEAFENAGLPLNKLVGSDTACFVGGFTREYDDVGRSELAKTLLYTTTGNGLTMMSNRLSWFYDLHGPSVSLDTACSSSLVAMHLACQAIKGSTSDTRQAIVGGVNLMLVPDQMTTMNPLHFLSPDSQCYSFDDRANGYTRGEGIGIMVLKHIDDAIRDGDCIRAVIRGTGVNSDGKTPGITLPSSEAQASLIRKTYKSAGLDPAHTGYFEAHGTGTSAGDPLEVGAIGSIFDRKADSASAPLYIGSVKPNIGHLEAGAGLAGLIKTVLTLETGVIPPNVNFLNENPKLRLKDYNFEIPTTPTPWPTQGLRRASVNSFGYGGTNGHCILDDAEHYLADRGITGRTRQLRTLPGTPDSMSTDSGVGLNENIESDTETFVKNSAQQHLRLFALSAPEQNALSRLGETLSSYLDEVDASKGLKIDAHLDQMAFTLGKRRSIFQWRTVVVASETSDIKTQLQALPKATRASKAPNMLFCFTGQGAQWHAMGRELVIYDVYRESIEHADTYLKSIGAHWSVLEELGKSKEDSQINKPEFSQPLCTVLQVALVDLFTHWNIRPTSVTGHSSGEIGAAYAAGALTAEDAWKVAFHRGRVSGNVRILAPHLKGSMMAVGVSKAEVEPQIANLHLADGETLSVACVNSGSSVTVSGDTMAVEKLEAELKAKDIFARKLPVENAYHSNHMKILVDDYLKSIEDIKPIGSASGVTIISSVTGAAIQPNELGAEYWVRNMVNPVQFLGAVEAAFATTKGGRRKKADAIDAIVEIGPHAALQGPIKQILTGINKVESTPYYTAIRRGTTADDSALHLAASLWSKGADVKLDLVNSVTKSPAMQVPLSDMPKYPWNHETHYWHECAPSKSHRFRQSPRTDLLGYPVKQFSLLEPQWKNILYLAELPWISDHKVRGNDVFPAAGMVCAALEGARQLADKARIVESFDFRDISIGRALMIPPADPGIEVFTRLTPQKNGQRNSQNPWYEFTFSSLEQNDSHIPTYVEHASGLVSVNYRSAESGIIVINEISAAAQSLKKDYEHIKDTAEVDVSKDTHYTNTLQMGFDYGPTFQGVEGAKIDVGQAAFDLKITDTKAIMPSEFEYEHLLHPATLDAAIQSASLAMRLGSENVNESMVPTGFQSLRVSARMPKGAETPLIGFTKAHRTGYRDNVATIMISDPEWSETMIEINDLGFTGLGDNTDQIIDDDQAIAMHKTCTETHWKPDIDLLDISKDHHQLLCGQGVERPEDLTAWGIVATKATAIFTKRALATVTPEIEANLAFPHNHLLQWMRDRLAENKKGKLDYQNGADWLNLSVKEEDQAIAAYEHDFPEDGKLVCAIGRNLPAILAKEVQPLEVMLQDDMLTTIYADGHALRSGLSMFRDWFDLQGYKQPGMKVLEIGAGTGSVTLPVLEVLGGTNGTTPRFSNYTFTDISTGWFEKAQELFKPWQGKIDFKKLNVEEDVFEQGFEAESFDVIAASNVLHATKRMDVTLTNCLKLLKPGGKLVVGELTYSQDCIGIAFGTLGGWWLSEDGREGGPLMTQEDWHHRLQSAGYSGLDLAVGAKDTLGDAKLSMMVSSKPVQTKSSDGLQQVVVIKPRLEEYVGNDVAVELKKIFSSNDIQVEFVDLQSASTRAKEGAFSKPGLSVISLLETDEHVFSRADKEAFEAIREVILKSSKLFWITAHASPEGVRHPESCAISGLFRAAKSENGRLRLHELHLQKRDSSQSADAANMISRVVNSAYGVDEDAEYEDEIVEANGLLTVPRLFDEEHLNRTLQTLGVTPQPEPQALSEVKRPLTLAVGKTGLLDTLFFADNESLLAPLPAGEIDIDVKAAAVNQSDVWVALGQISDLVLGIEGAGVVTKIGSSVNSLKVGDKVAFTTPGAMSTHVRVTPEYAHILPKNMSLEDGASIPYSFMAAYQSLLESARLQSGEKILIHSAAGGLGQAMIQIAQHIGAEIFVTVSTEEKGDLMRSYGIADDHIFNSRTLDFAKGIKRVTDGHGVDVIINTLANEALRQTWACISPFGRFIELGKKDVINNVGLEMRHFSANASFSAVDIQHIVRTAPARARLLLTKVFNLFNNGVLKVVHPIQVTDFSNVQEGFRILQNGYHSGKVVLSKRDDSVVPCLPHDANPLELRSEATYVLVGGLGGLGRGLSGYLADHGAKHLAYFSRTKDIQGPAQKVLEELAIRGVQANIYVCDVADPEALKESIAQITSEMPPIKGVIQGAMVLRDGLFENMSYDNWSQATTPKIQGSWNLHESMPADVDFFIMLSSLAGILGNRGQSNYCAGNTYQDQLAHYRRSLGLPAQTVDLGAIGGLGWFEENKEDLKFAETMQNLIVQKDEFYALMKSAMTGYSHGGNKIPTQIVTGVGSGGLNKANRAAGAPIDYYWLDEAPRMSYLRQLDLHSTKQAEQGDELGELKGSLSAVTTMAAAVDLIQNAVATKLAKSMMIAVDEIDVNRPVSSYGVDSLVAAEMRNWCFRDLKADISVFELLSGNSITVLSGQIAERSTIVPEGIEKS